MNKKKFFKIVFITVSSFCLLVAAALGTIYVVNPAALSNNSVLGSIINGMSSAPQKPINVLFLGCDKVGLNTDVIVTANINPQTKKINIVSIPRDTRVNYDGHHKINSVYGKGREPAIKEKVTEVIGQNIDYVVLANTEGFRSIIDTLGGVDVDVPRNMNYDDYDQNLHIHLKKGLQHLDGNKAEQFVRFRHGYAEGDLGRIAAQQIFFKALIEQKLKPQYILKADKVLSEVFKNVKTDMPLDVAIKYSLFAKDLPSENVSFLELPGAPKTIGGASYFIYDSEEIDRQIKDKFSHELTATTTTPTTPTAQDTTNNK